MMSHLKLVNDSDFGSLYHLTYNHLNITRIRKKNVKSECQYLLMNQPSYSPKKEGRPQARKK